MAAVSDDVGRKLLVDRQRFIAIAQFTAHYGPVYGPVTNGPKDLTGAIGSRAMRLMQAGTCRVSTI